MSVSSPNDVTRSLSPVLHGASHEAPALRPSLDASPRSSQSSWHHPIEMVSFLNTAAPTQAVSLAEPRTLPKGFVKNRIWSSAIVLAAGYATSRFNAYPGIPLPFYAAFAMGFVPFFLHMANTDLRGELGDEVVQRSKSLVVTSEVLSALAAGTAEVGGTCLATALRGKDQEKADNTQGLLIGMGVLFGVAALLQAASIGTAARAALRPNPTEGAAEARETE